MKWHDTPHGLGSHSKRLVTDWLVLVMLGQEVIEAVGVREMVAQAFLVQYTTKVPYTALNTCRAPTEAKFSSASTAVQHISKKKVCDYLHYIISSAYFFYTTSLTERA